MICSMIILYMKELWSPRDVTARIMDIDIVVSKLFDAKVTLVEEE